MDDPTQGALVAPFGPPALSDDTLPRGSEDSLNPFVVCSMIYNNASSIFGSSYDKESNRFAMNIEDALEAATGMFLKAFDMHLVRPRMVKIAEKMSANDLLLAVSASAASPVPPNVAGASAGGVSASFDFE